MLAVRSTPLASRVAAPRAARANRLVVRADFIGSPENLSVVVGTTLCLAAGRFGLAPTANRPASAGLKLSTRDAGMKSGDPAGFTFVDTLALGAMGHIIGVGMILGHRALGL